MKQTYKRKGHLKFFELIDFEEGGGIQFDSILFLKKVASHKFLEEKRDRDLPQRVK